MSRFHACIPIILRHEGGYVDHPSDPGGATNMGITHRTLASWRGEPVTKQDVQRLMELEAREIYRARYWNAVRADDLPPGVDLVVFDFAVNAGVSRSAKLLQRLVYATADGAVGPQTLAAVRRMDPVALINGFSEGRMQHYRSLRIWETFKNGWTRRTSEVRTAALQMALTPAAPAPAVSNPSWLQDFISKVTAWLQSLTR